MKFEDLEVWRRAARLSAGLYKELQGLKDFGFRDQITRAGLSISSNIAEGFERQSNRECVAFLSYAKGSCGEVRSQVYVGLEIGYIGRERGADWIRETNEISSMLGALITTRRGFARKKDPGSRGEERGRHGRQGSTDTGEATGDR